MKFHFIILFLVCAIFAFTARAAVSSPLEDEIFSKFEAICLWNINDLSRVPYYLNTLGMRELSQSEAVPLLDGKIGRAWIEISGGAKVAIILTDNGACSLYGRDGSGGQLQKVLEGTLNQKKLATDDVGSHRREIYAVYFPNPRGGPDTSVLVSITFSKLSSIVGLILDAIPGDIARKRGIPVPRNNN